VVPGEATREQEVNDYLIARLVDLGVPREAIASDETFRQSEYGGTVGNLVVRLDGHGQGERIMLSSHMDTVPSVIGCQPRIDGDRIVNDAPDRALGGDARCGCVCVLAAIRATLDLKGDHGPRTFVLFVQEELGLVGARGMDTSLLGDPLPGMCFNFDASEPNGIANQVVGTQRLNIDITGVPSHGARPQRGISAAMIAADALADLKRTGWTGVVEQPEGKGFSNIGVLRGGKNSNILMPELYGLVEARSFDREFRERIIAAWRRAFEAAVTQHNADATEVEEEASVAFAPGPVYDPCYFAEDSPIVERARKAIADCGMEAFLFEHAGGMDTCQIAAHGIPAVGLGMGEYQAHSADEWIDIPKFVKSCEVAVALATS
jgi:tripeptide aminopeptidase